MPTALDLVYVALFAGVLPLWDYAVFWRRHDAEMRADPAGRRRKTWLDVIIWSWLLVFAGAALWIWHDRPWAPLGLNLPEGWRLWVSVGLVAALVTYLVIAARAVATDPKARESVRKQFTGRIADILPHTKVELRWFAAVSLTAGFCEEFLFRGFFLWALSPWLGWWGAAALSMVSFAAGHAYQGWSGVLRTGATGLLLTVIYAVFESLWPAIAIHAIVDLGNGTIGHLALKPADESDGQE